MAHISLSEWPVTRQTNTGQMETGERADLKWHRLQRPSAGQVGFCKTRGNLFGVRMSGNNEAQVFGGRSRCYRKANETIKTGQMHKSVDDSHKHTIAI